MTAPKARVDSGQDPYKWLENRDAPEVLDYLKAENAHLESQLAEQADLRESLFQEIKGRIRETDLSLPSPWGPSPGRSEESFAIRSATYLRFSSAMRFTSRRRCSARARTSVSMVSTSVVCRR